MPGGDRRVEGGAAILDAAGAVQPAMRERLARSAARELTPALTATIASISTAAPSGSTGTPTALRAWRPASPNTFSISSEAPLATLGWSVKCGVRGDERAELDDPLDPVERAERLLHLREQHQPRSARPPRVPCATSRSSPSRPMISEPSVERQLPGNVEQPAGLDRRHIGRDRRGGFGQGDAELGEAGVDAVGHGQARKHSSGAIVKARAPPSASRARIHGTASSHASIRAWACGRRRGDRGDARLGDHVQPPHLGRVLRHRFVVDGEIVDEDGRARRHFGDQLGDRPALAALIARAPGGGCRTPRAGRRDWRDIDRRYW